MRCRFTRPLTLLAALAVASVGLAQEQVFRSLTAEKMEDMLKSLNFDFKKIPSKTQSGTFYYDFKKNNYTYRLSFFNGKDLMVDVLFKAYPLDKLNQWNQRAKFSRASLGKDSMGEYTALEYNLDLIGGVTESTIRQYFKTFDDEIVAFEKFMGGSGSVPPKTDPKPDPKPPVGGIDETVTDSFSSDRVEALLKKMNLAYNKKELKNGGHYFDFESKGFKIRMYAYAGGRDLMLDAVFKKLPLESVNKYNLDRKFIRIVAYEGNNNPYTAIETNLDCAGGVSESMVRHFIVTFDEELRAFSEFVNKN